MPVVKVTIVEAITVEAGLAIVGMVVLEAVLGTLFVKNVGPPIWLDRDNLNSLKWTLTQKTELI
jgi:hypothetical protein